MPLRHLDEVTASFIQATALDHPDKWGVEVALGASSQGTLFLLYIHCSSTRILTHTTAALLLLSLLHTVHTIHRH